MHHLFLNAFSSLSLCIGAHPQVQDLELTTRRCQVEYCGEVDAQSAGSVELKDVVPVDHGKWTIVSWNGMTGVIEHDSMGESRAIARCNADATQVNWIAVDSGSLGSGPLLVLPAGNDGWFLSNRLQVGADRGKYCLVRAIQQLGVDAYFASRVTLDRTVDRGLPLATLFIQGEPVLLTSDSIIHIQSMQLGQRVLVNLAKNELLLPMYMDVSTAGVLVTLLHQTVDTGSGESRIPDSRQSQHKSVLLYDDSTRQVTVYDQSLLAEDNIQSVHWAGSYVVIQSGHAVWCLDPSTQTLHKVHGIMSGTLEVVGCSSTGVVYCATPRDPLRVESFRLPADLFPPNER